MNPIAFARFAAVIPAYNEASTLREVAIRSLQQLARVIVVDDGSTDGTAAALAGLPVTLLRNKENLGKAASLWRGMQYAMREETEAVITLDGDRQHEPEDIPRLIEAHRHNPRAIVIGARLHDKHKIPPARYYANRFANFWIAWAAGCPFVDSQSGFRVYPTQLLRAVKIAHDKTAGFVFESEILIEAGRCGFPVMSVPIKAIYSSRSRPSHFREVTDIARIVRMVAWKLISRGMCLPGLVRSLRGRAETQPITSRLERN